MPTGGDCSEDGVNIIKHCLHRYGRLGTQVLPNVQLSLLLGWGQRVPPLLWQHPLCPHATSFVRSSSDTSWLLMKAPQHGYSLGGVFIWLPPSRLAGVFTWLPSSLYTILFHTRPLSCVLSCLLLIVLFLWKSQGMMMRGEESCVHEWFLKRSPLLELYSEVFMDQFVYK